MERAALVYRFGILCRIIGEGYRQSRLFSVYTRVRGPKHTKIARLSGCHYPTTIGGNSIEKFQKQFAIGTQTNKCLGFFPSILLSYSSRAAVRSGMPFPTWDLPRPGFLYGGDTSQPTLHGSSAHCSVQTMDKTSDMLYFLKKFPKASFKISVEGSKACNFSVF